MYGRVKSLYEEMEEGFDKNEAENFEEGIMMDIVVPDVRTYNTLISVCAKLKKLTKCIILWMKCKNATSSRI